MTNDLNVCCQCGHAVDLLPEATDDDGPIYCIECDKLEQAHRKLAELGLRYQDEVAALRTANEILIQRAEAAERTLEVFLL